MAAAAAVASRLAPARNKLLVCNAGSSSLKFKLYQLAAGQAEGTGAAGATDVVPAGSASPPPAAAHHAGPHGLLLPLAAGLCERIGDPEGSALMRASFGSDRWREGERVEAPMPDHGTALAHVFGFLSRSAAAVFTAGGAAASNIGRGGGVELPAAALSGLNGDFPAGTALSAAGQEEGSSASSASSTSSPAAGSGQQAEAGAEAGAGSSFLREVLAVGHRVVHGGSITHSLLLDEAARASLEEASQLAPLHNPPSLHCIDAARRLFPGTPHVAVFDTTFHTTLAPEAYTYALPTDLCRQHRIRRYGFHGISFQYLTGEAARMLGKRRDDVSLIICHLGNGSSMAAVQGGRCIDTTMGLTPLEGLVMGSRCGDIDPAIAPFLIGKGMSAEEVDDVMNKQSGFLGMTGSIDVRSVEECAEQGDQACQLALAVYVRRVRKYLGAFLVHLGGKVDAVVFSAGIGENGSMLRELICRDLRWAGIAGVDEAANDATVKGKAGEVQAPGGRTKILVIPTDEQLEIAQEVLRVVAGSDQGQEEGPAPAT